ncbi:UNVERIFIED_CONTAM: hypothetical protein GTU68_046902 [Idotea baltica]|nr:hypothetical protein [Idotea baltica]
MEARLTELVLTPGQVSLSELGDVYWNGASVKLDRVCKDAVENASQRISTAAQSDAPIYGVNTGFGKLASIKIASEDAAILQRNLILSHCCGVGESIPRHMVRLMMSLKLLSFGRGASGVRWDCVELLERMLARGVTPVIPAQGSVGASGDLAPLAHMTAVVIGEGRAEYQGTLLSGAEALAKADLSPVILGPKEGLAFINGTQFSTAFALAGLFEGWRAAQNALVTSAMSTDAIMGSTAPTQPEIHALRGHRGQIEAAASIRALLDGSIIRKSHIEGDTRVQDPYCIRCQPQVTGAAMDVLRQAAMTLEIEANAATDNPLVLSDPDIIVLAVIFNPSLWLCMLDMIALAHCRNGAIAQAPYCNDVDPALKQQIYQPFLTPQSG